MIEAVVLFAVFCNLAALAVMGFLFWGMINSSNDEQIELIRQIGNAYDSGRQEREALEQKLMALTDSVTYTQYQAQKDEAPQGSVGYVEDENLDTQDPEAIVIEPVQPIGA